MGVLAPQCAPSAPDPGDVITELKTYISRDKVRPGETFKAALRLTIGPGWHVNANPASDELLVPTRLEIADGAGSFQIVEIVYPEPTMTHLSLSEDDVGVYSGCVLLGALIRAGDGLKTGAHKLRGAVTWQACNDVSCLPPESRDFEIEIVVAGPGQETRDDNAAIFEKMEFGPR